MLYLFYRTHHNPGLCRAHTDVCYTVSRNNNSTQSDLLMTGVYDQFLMHQDGFQRRSRTRVVWSRQVSHADYSLHGHTSSMDSCRHLPHLSRFHQVRVTQKTARRNRGLTHLAIPLDLLHAFADACGMADIRALTDAAQA